MKTVTLYRHAKSDWKDSPAIADFDRPLAKRGLKAAPRMGEVIRAHHIRPDLILCSPSVRTRQTLALSLDRAWDEPPPVRYDETLYHAPAAEMLGLLRALADGITHVMIVGHNPGLQELAHDLASRKSAKRRELLTSNFPTAALASFAFETGTWQQLQPGTGELLLYTTPKQLDAA
jgi:phosphohistidine phosphatase